MEFSLVFFWHHHHSCLEPLGGIKILFSVLINNKNIYVLGKKLAWLQFVLSITLVQERGDASRQLPAHVQVILSYKSHYNIFCLKHMMFRHLQCLHRNICPVRKPLKTDSPTAAKTNTNHIKHCVTFYFILTYRQFLVHIITYTYSIKTCVIL